MHNLTDSLSLLDRDDTMAIDAQGLRDLTNAILAAAPAPAPAQAPRARDIVVRDLSEATPEAWRAWRSQFEVAADLNNWNDARQRKVAFISMTGKAREAVAHIPHGVPVAPAGGGPAPACPAASLLLDEMEARFLPPAAGAVARRVYRQAAQMEDETISQWHSRLRALATSCLLYTSPSPRD